MNILLSLLGFGRMLREWAGVALRWALTPIWHVLVVAIAVALVWGWIGWHEAHKWERVAESTFAAQKAAGEAQEAVNHEPAAKSAAIARKSDDEAPAYYDAARRAAADHAIRLRPTACASGPADLPGTDTPVEGVHGPAPTPPLVCRPFVEDNQIVRAAARAAEMHQEALDLIAEGAAVASEGNQ